MNFLLDTNVISETRRKRPDANVLAWLTRADPPTLHISVLTLGEIAKGALKIARRDTIQGTALLEWFDRIRIHYADQMVDIDAEIAEAWGRLAAERPFPVIDGLLAATALVRGMTFVTRDLGGVAATGVPIINPWRP